MTSKKLVLALAGLMAGAFAGSNATAQVRDVSVMVSPYASYNWWNSNIALKNSPFVGARVGFGFGPFFEIRANYEQSINLKTPSRTRTGILSTRTPLRSWTAWT